MITEVRLPEIAENVQSGEVVHVLIHDGDTVEKDQPIIEIETEKAAFEIPSPEKGKIVEIDVHDGDTLKVGQTILKLETGDGAARREPKKQPQPVSMIAEETIAPTPKPAERQKMPEVKMPASPAQLAPAAPSVRREARELGIDVHEVPGHGPGGRIMSEDVKEFAKKTITSVEQPSRAPSEELPDFSSWGPVERVPMSKVRLLTAENLYKAWTTIPHVSHFDKADITEVEAFRKSYASQVAKAGGKLTITAIMVKIAALALKRFPIFNASLDMARKEIIYKKFIHIGIAVDTERGLLVPVIRNADKKSITALSVETAILAEKARKKTIAPDEMKGAGFTISNLGGIGGTGFTPIINPPQVAILGIVRAQTEPVYANGSWTPRSMLPLSLSYDHRVIDGADGARFLHWICEALRNPLFIALEGEL